MKDNAAFKASFAAAIKRAGDKAELVAKKVAIDMLSTLVATSPVDTGRFRNNWNVGVGGINPDVGSQADASGGGALSTGVNSINGLKMGQTVWITNSLPYAKRLEYGWSQQAPQGMVRVAVIEFGNKLAQAAQEVK